MSTRATTPEGDANTETDFTPAYEGAEVLPFNLVLEGGAMRGLFTAGVLDYFMEHKLFAQTVFGVSAGALMGYNYISGALGRAAFINVKYCDNWQYLSLRNILHTGSAYGVDFVFNRIPNELDPFDYENAYQSPMRLITVATDLQTGEPDYHQFGTPETDMDYIIASSAMPFVSKITEVDGKFLLDGGTSDSVPIDRSMATGCEKQVIVLTREDGYIKDPNPASLLAGRVYADYPYYVERIQGRHFEYNRLYRRLKRMEEAGEILILRPQKPVEVASMEHNPDKLIDLYAQGYEQAALNHRALMAYLEA